MPIRLALLYLIAALLLPLGAASAAGLPVSAKAIVFKNKDVDISVKYPQTGNRAIDGVLADYARRSAAAFKTYQPDFANNDHQYALETTYAVERNDGQVFAVLFSLYEDTGGAHPNSDYAAFDFLMPDGAQIFLPEIVDGSRGLKRVSQIVQSNLMRDIASGPDALSDKDTIAMGTAPIADNFKHFVLLPGRLHIYFPPYQVAAYAAGPQETFVSLAQIKDVLRPDWRAPAASFDCARAASTIEHAVCADVALARLDRQVAEAYQVALHNAYQPVDQEKVRQAQRDWLGKRNAACGGPSPGVCLTKFYRDRLAVLTNPPA